MNELLAYIKDLEAKGYYDNVRELPDGTIVGTQRLMFTTAIFVGLNEWGWERRFCFEDPAVAVRELNKMESGEDIPVGWIARRGR